MMGVRGKSSGLKNPQQITLDDALITQEVQDLIKKSIANREEILSLVGISGGTKPMPTAFKKCFCCGEYTIPINIEYTICSVCGWIDDKYQNTHPDSLNGKNSITLNQAKGTYKDIKT